MAFLSGDKFQQRRGGKGKIEWLEYFASYHHTHVLSPDLSPTFSKAALYIIFLSTLVISQTFYQVI